MWVDVFIYEIDGMWDYIFVYNYFFFWPKVGRRHSRAVTSLDDAH